VAVPPRAGSSRTSVGSSGLRLAGPAARRVPPPCQPPPGVRRRRSGVAWQPDTCARSRRSGGKTDALDAIRAARSVLGQTRPAQPRAGGEREALRALTAAREGAMNAKRAGLCQLRDLLVTAPELHMISRHPPPSPPRHDRLHQPPQPRRQEQPRSNPLPQALPRPQPLPAPRERANADLTYIEASLARAVLVSLVDRGFPPMRAAGARGKLGGMVEDCPRADEAAEEASHRAGACGAET
jgi:hypothetical protein